MHDSSSKDKSLHNKIDITPTGKDISGHLVNERGYLVNSEGDILNRQGFVLFRYCELKAGEFPKIFKFSKLDMKHITGHFKRDPNG